MFNLDDIKGIKPVAVMELPARMPEIVTVELSRYDQLIRAEIQLEIVRRAFETGAAYALHDLLAPVFPGGKEKPDGEKSSEAQAG